MTATDLRSFLHSTPSPELQAALELSAQLLQAKNNVKLLEILAADAVAKLSEFERDALLALDAKMKENKG